MKMRSYGKTILYAGALLLIGSIALAQTSPKKDTPHQKPSSPATPGSAKSMGSAHATESLTASAPSGTTESKQDLNNSNPMYKENSRSGVNPLYEGKDSVAPKPRSGASPTVQFKDGEDTTARYRPGNNKTSKIDARPAPGGATSH